MRKNIWSLRDSYEKDEKPNGTKIVVCNYLSKEFKWSKSRGYDTYWWHANNLHPTKIMKSKAKNQTQIARYTSPTQLFSYFDANNT